LVDCGLVREEGGVLYPTPELSNLVATVQDEAVELLLARALKIVSPVWLVQNADPPLDVKRVIEDLISDPDKREAFLLAIAGRYDPAVFAAKGARGEEVVAALARQELSALGHPDLASQVQRVSLVSDMLGYDVVAPRLDHQMRRLEVKTTGRASAAAYTIYLSRNEIEVGRRDHGWALVICKVEADNQVDVVGWCRAGSLEQYVPVDSAGGSWQEAELIVPKRLLFPEIPPAL